MAAQTRTKKRTATVVIALAVAAGSALVLRAAMRRTDAPQALHWRTPETPSK
jgi:hypothetical protein